MIRKVVDGALFELYLEKCTFGVCISMRRSDSETDTVAYMNLNPCEALQLEESFRKGGGTVSKGDFSIVYVSEAKWDPASKPRLRIERKIGSRVFGSVTMKMEEREIACIRNFITSMPEHLLGFGTWCESGKDVCMVEDRRR